MEKLMTSSHWRKDLAGSFLHSFFPSLINSTNDSGASPMCWALCPVPCAKIQQWWMIQFLTLGGGWSGLIEKPGYNPMIYLRGEAGQRGNTEQDYFGYFGGQGVCWCAQLGPGWPKNFAVLKDHPNGHPITDAWIYWEILLKTSARCYGLGD